MNMYQFGNYVCRLREEKGMTQAELAMELGVTDKSVSKWENGQAFPRIETFERLAAVLGTTMQDILSASRDGVNRVCFVNQHPGVVRIEVNGVPHALRREECRWVEVEPGEVILVVRGDAEPEVTPPAAADATAGAKLRSRAARLLERVAARMSLHVCCTYRLTGAEEKIITISTGEIEVEEPLWVLPVFNMEYLRVAGEGVTVELMDVQAMDRRDAISAYKKMTIAWTLGENVLLLLLAYPLSGLFARWQCRKKVIRRRIEDAEAERKARKRKGGCLGMLLPLCLILVLVLLRLLPPVIGNGGDYLVRADREVITWGEDTYHRIDALPEDAEPVTVFGAVVWEVAWIEGDFWDRLEQDVKVQLFVDDEGGHYLWLVEDYADTMLPEDGSEVGYGDFETHMVYQLQ